MPRLYGKEDNCDTDGRIEGRADKVARFCVGLILFNKSLPHVRVHGALLPPCR